MTKWMNLFAIIINNLDSYLKCLRFIIGIESHFSPIKKFQMLYRRHAEKIPELSSVISLADNILFLHLPIIEKHTPGYNCPTNQANNYSKENECEHELYFTRLTFKNYFTKTKSSRCCLNKAKQKFNIF